MHDAPACSVTPLGMRINLTFHIIVSYVQVADPYKSDDVLRWHVGILSSVHVEVMLLNSVHSLFFLCAAVLASPSTLRAPEERLIVNPPVTEPTASTVWVVGNRYNVTWYVGNLLACQLVLLANLSRDITQLPPFANITNDVGRIVLGQFDGDGERLYTGMVYYHVFRLICLRRCLFLSR